ncbi:hypothetical protein LTR56_005726 [Elasticomyces elasticus]|nr:hypothetical protein LTR56_005726 [Elasticomyces elasticus]KAK3657477.1 hypothetical protein LTR22_009343 [Elasticomyces elasticus]KAK4925656.1 hypothetical protein LTR49_007266 [Elasticomyces elasticus]KAK5764988.1 hypothetical protein LTS12_004766 [Elasticomyces elasticus]
MVKFSAVLRRCERWAGDVTELAEIDNTIGNVFNAENWHMVESFALALLERDPPPAQALLPPLYKAKMYTYLSGHPDYPEDSNLLVARSWIDRAVKDAIAHIGFVPAEIQEWKDMIEKQLALPVPSNPSDLALESLTIGGMDGTMDGAMDSSTVEVPHNKDKCKQCLYHKYGDFVPEMIEPPAPETPLETATAKLAEAQRKIKEIKAEDVAQQRLRRRLAGLPASQRMRMASASFTEGTGTVGTLHRSLKAKKSMRDFAASRVLPFAGAPRQQEPVEEEDEAMADVEPKKAEEGDERDERSMWNE